MPRSDSPNLASKRRRIQPSFAIGLLGLVLFAALGTVGGDGADLVGAAMFAALYFFATGIWTVVFGRSWLGKLGRARGGGVLGASVVAVLVAGAFLPPVPPSTDVDSTSVQPKGTPSPDPSPAASPTTNPTPTASPTATPEPPSTPGPTTTDPPPAAARPPRIAGYYTGTLTVSVYEGWYDEDDESAPAVGDQLAASLSMHASCDADSTCSFDHSSFDPDWTDPGRVDSASVEHGNDLSSVRYAEQVLYDCVDLAGNDVGDVWADIDYVLTFSNASGGGSTVAVHYEVNTASDTTFCEPARLVTVGSLTR